MRERHETHRREKVSSEIGTDGEEWDGEVGSERCGPSAGRPVLSVQLYFSLLGSALLGSLSRPTRAQVLDHGCVWYGLWIWLAEER